MDNGFWVGKKVLLSGASGFVGSHLLSWLKDSGASVVGISRTGRSGTIAVDGTDFTAVDRLFNTYHFDMIFHLGGSSLVETGELFPRETFVNNINSTLTMLELGRKYKTKRIVIASTVHVYGSGSGQYSEEDPPRPSRPYETSKTCSDLVAQSYADSFRLPVLIPRFVNIYGPGDTNRSRLIPKTILTILSGKNPVMWGGQAVREYLYVDDAVRAYIALAEIQDHAIIKNRIYNFGSGEAITVERLIRRILSIMESKQKIRLIHDDRPDESLRLRVRTDKAGKMLQWYPAVKLEDGIKKTVEWYKNSSYNQ